MEFCETAGERGFRQEVRGWLQDNRPKGPRPDDPDFAAQKAYDQAWQRTQYEGGWAGIAWPKEYGGRGLSPTEQLIWCEEYAIAGCPTVSDSMWMGLNHAGPVLMACGNEAQKAFHLPRILRAEEAWCQGFSEPGAGSDLASLRTRGEIDGDHLVVNGQKIWTSYGHYADYTELLVRTGPPESRHRGLTWVICDLRTPGVVVRPIVALSGRVHNCEVFYDDVRIPLTNVVGEINEGWSVALATLNNERGAASFNTFCELAAALEQLVVEAGPALHDPATAERVGRLRAEVQSLRGLILVMASAAEQHVELGAEGIIMHLPLSEQLQAVGRLALEIKGETSLSRGASHEWLDHYFTAFAATIAAGTSEIQRNLIGERLLGLPR